MQKRKGLQCHDMTWRDTSASRAIGTRIRRPRRREPERDAQRRKVQGHRKDQCLDRGQGSGLRDTEGKMNDKYQARLIVETESITYLLELAGLGASTSVLSTGDGTSATVQFSELGNVELRALKDLDLADVDVLERVDALASLGDLTAHNLRDKLGNKLLEVTAAGFTLDDLEHLLADSTDLRRLGVCGLRDLVGTALGEANAEEAEQVAIGGLDVGVRLDEGLPLADKRANLVGGEVHTVEVGQAGAAGNLVDAELELAVGLLLVVVQVGEGLLQDAALERIVGVLCRTQWRCASVAVQFSTAKIFFPISQAQPCSRPLDPGTPWRPDTTVSSHSSARPGW